MHKNKISKILKQIFKKYGLNLSHSRICTDALINAELVGAQSHGLSRLKMYCDRISKKLINPKVGIEYIIANIFNIMRIPNWHINISWLFAI